MLNQSEVENKEYSVAIYMRLSKDDGDKEESESITNQRKILQSFVKENNYTLYDEYVDDGYSGTNFNRPNFKRMVEDIKNKRVNMVITKNLARLGRDYIETGKYIEKFFPENQVRYIAILDDVDTFLDRNCDTVAFKNIMNDFYAKETSKNVKKTKNRKKQEGFYYITYAPFGYRKLDKQGHLEIDPDSSSTVIKIFKEFISGKGTYQIATLLNKEKVTTPGLQMDMTNVVNNITNTTNEWTHTTVRRILENPVYIGYIVQNKRKKISYKSKKMINLPKEQQTIIKNHHPAIINLDTWNLVQKILNNSDGTKIKEEDPLLKQFLYCPHCFNKLQTITKKEKYKEKITIRRYVMCPNGYKKITNKPCYRRYINYDKLEKETLDIITKVFQIYLNSKEFDDEKLVNYLIGSKNNKNKIEKKYHDIKEQLEKINKKIRMLYSDRLNGLIEEQDYQMFSENLINERRRLENLEREISKEIEEFEDSVNEKKIERKAKSIIQNIVAYQDFKKEDLQELIEKIEIDKEKNVEIKFRFYELNCIGGYFKYDGKQAVNS